MTREGSGSLLITVGKHLNNTEKKDLHYYGQEKNTTTYNLARMNLLLHGVRPEKMTLRNANTLGYDWPEDPTRPNEGVQFDAVVMNPPYSAKNWNKDGLKVSDPRFQIGGVLPPNSKGDFAFLLHGLFHLRQSGTMAIVLPHGVLFRGGAEGEIRQRLLEKNYIDIIIGLPSNLFTNTGIPVVIIVLKKNRKLEEPILVIDSSEEFIKVGKQNVLEEKNIAKIVDTYVEKNEEEGYSALVYRKDLIENDYNMNIPRYVVKISEEIEHDVEGHLIGAIPKKDIEGLKILNLLVKDILYKSLEEVDNGYYILSKKIDELTKEILTSNEVVEKSKSIKEKTDLYIKKYWDKLINVDENSDINSIKKDMLLEIKEIMEEFSYVNIYNGYQNISNIWEENLKTDLELIKACDFYELGRKREPNIVVKGTGKKKREEQEGWVGSLVPNELIVQNLYSKENQEIEDLKNKLSDIESSLDEIVENTKIEGTEEYEVLYDCLNKNKDDEVTNSFGKTAVKNEKKMYEKDSEEYKMLKNVEKLMDDKTSINKEIKFREEELKKNAEDRIVKLKDEEIDKIIYDKWFKNLESEMINLIEKLKNIKSAYLSEMFPKEGELYPKRRFAGFTKPWEEKKLGDVVDVNSGKDYKHLSIGNIPVYGTGGYMLSVNKALSYDDAIGIGRKGTIDKPYILKSPFWTVDTLFYVTLKKNNNLNFIFGLFQKIDWKSMDESSGVPSLSRININNVTIKLASLQEQEKIGNFFKKLDERIILQEEKIEKLENMKKAYLSEMFV